MNCLPDLETVVAEIIELLQQCGRDDQATWLEARLSLLIDVHTTADERERAVNELHGVVLGMGGLMDLSLRPTSQSGHTQTSAREQLDLLSDWLYELTS